MEIILAANTGRAKVRGGIAGDEFSAQRRCQRIREQDRLPAPSFGCEIVGNGANTIVPPAKRFRGRGDAVQLCWSFMKPAKRWNR